MVRKKNKKVKKDRPTNKKLPTLKSKSKTVLVKKKTNKQKTSFSQINLFFSNVITSLRRLLSVFIVFLKMS